MKLKLEHYFNEKMNRSDSKCLKNLKFEQFKQLEHQNII